MAEGKAWDERQRLIMKDLMERVIWWRENTPNRNATQKGSENYDNAAKDLADRYFTLLGGDPEQESPEEWAKRLLDTQQAYNESMTQEVQGRQTGRFITETLMRMNPLISGPQLTEALADVRDGTMPEESTGQEMYDFIAEKIFRQGGASYKDLELNPHLYVPGEQIVLPMGSDMQNPEWSEPIYNPHTNRPWNWQTDDPQELAKVIAKMTPAQVQKIEGDPKNVSIPFDMNGDGQMTDQDQVVKATDLVGNAKTTSEQAPKGDPQEQAQDTARDEAVFGNNPTFAEHGILSNEDLAHRIDPRTGKPITVRYTDENGNEISPFYTKQDAFRKWQEWKAMGPEMMRKVRMGLLAEGFYGSDVTADVIDWDSGITRMDEQALTQALDYHTTNTTGESIEAMLNIDGVRFGDNEFDVLRESVRGTLHQYGMPDVSDRIVNTYAKNISHNEYDQKEFVQKIKDQAMARYPQWEQQIKSGQTVEELAAPYKATMSQLLEIPEQNIKWDDATFQAGIDGRNKDGQPESMPTWKFRDYIQENDDRWLATDNAHDHYEAMGNAILARFGY